MSRNRKPRVRRKFFFFPSLIFKTCVKSWIWFARRLFQFRRLQPPVLSVVWGSVPEEMRQHPRRGCESVLFLLLWRNPLHAMHVWRLTLAGFLWLLMILVWLSVAGIACSFGIETQSEEDYEARLVGSWLRGKAEFFFSSSAWLVTSCYICYICYQV